MTTTVVTPASVQQFIKSLQAQYKYYVAGKLDGLLQAVGNIVNDDPTFNLLKAIRTQETYTLSGIQKSSNDANTKLTLSAAAKLSFLRSSINAVAAQSQTGNAKAVTKAVATLEEELHSATADYATGMNGAQPTAKDRSILASIQQMNDTLRTVLYAQQPRLTHVNVYYSVDSVKAFKQIDSTKTIIAQALAGTYVLPASSSSASGDTSTSSSTTGASGTDILV